MLGRTGRWLRSQLRTLLWWVWPTSPTAWSELPNRLAPAAIQVARLTVAAVVAYVVAGRLIPAGAVDLTAPLTALLVVQASTSAPCGWGWSGWVPCSPGWWSRSPWPRRSG
jgi:hypothetical protein